MNKQSLQSLWVAVLLLTPGLANANAGFDRLIKLPLGAVGKRTPAFVADMNHDGFMEFGFWWEDRDDTPSAGWQIWKCIPPDSFVLAAADTNEVGPETPWGLVPWDAGDIDSDGRIELVGFASSGTPDYIHYVQTVEAEDNSSLPSEINWMNKYDEGGIDIGLPFYITNLDQDEKEEILFIGGWRSVQIYENVWNDSNRLVWVDTLIDEGLEFEKFVWGDFDKDGLMEFVSSDWADPDYIVWEHTGADNDYHRVYQGKVEDEGAGAADVFGGEDMDGDGAPEFFFNAHWGMGTTDMELWRYYAVGDNTYEGERVDTVPNSWVEGILKSDVGDVDGDGLLEVVWNQGIRLQLLDDAQHGYVRLGSWINDHGIPHLLVTCADLDLDGRDEMIVTGNFRTSVLKWTGSGVSEQPGAKPQASWKLLSPIGREIRIRYMNFPQGLTAAIYDAAGRKVDEVCGNQSSGIITWGEGLAPGVYFVVPFDSSLKPKKVVLTR